MIKKAAVQYTHANIIGLRVNVDLISTETSHVYEPAMQANAKETGEFNSEVHHLMT